MNHHNLDAEQVANILGRQRYKFARTQPWNPHYYTLKDTWEDPTLYKAVIAWILENGELRKWGKKSNPPRRYFACDGWRYWPMTTDPEESILLNRVDMAIDKSVPYEPPVESDQIELKLE